jgi:Family of unknown function (DUF5906)
MSDERHEYEGLCDHILEEAGIKPINGRADEDELGRLAALAEAHMAEMNDKYAVVQIGGRTRVMHFEDDATYPGCRVPVFQSITDFKAFHHKHKIQTDKGSVVGRGHWWINNPLRRQYDGVEFAPGDKPVTATGKLNLWQGFAVKAKEGNCGLLLAHMEDNVCAGNADHYEYLMNWFARGVQQPDKQGEVALVMRGEEGVGKGIVANNYGRLFGSHYHHISNPRHLVGNFNAFQQQCSVLFADEAFFAGDRSQQGILKSLITEPELHVELKGVDSFRARNRLHVIMASNESWVVPAGTDARRYFVLDVGNGKKQNTDYFEKIVQQMDNGGREAFLHVLKTRDISTFNVRVVPQTAALADQKRHSRRGVDALVEHVAYEGELFEAHPSYPDIAITSEGQDRKGFFKAAQSMFPDLKHCTWIIASRTLKDEWGCEPWRSSTQRGIKFPPLAELREKFDRKHGAQQWDPAEDWGGATILATRPGNPSHPSCPPQPSNDRGLGTMTTMAGMTGSGVQSRESVCDHCGRLGATRFYDWPNRPEGVWLHPDCEIPWWDKQTNPR